MLTTFIGSSYMDNLFAKLLPSAKRYMDSFMSVVCVLFLKVYNGYQCKQHSWVTASCLFYR